MSIYTLIDGTSTWPYNALMVEVAQLPVFRLYGQVDSAICRPTDPF